MIVGRNSKPGFKNINQVAAGQTETILDGQNGRGSFDLTGIKYHEPMDRDGRRQMKMTSPYDPTDETFQNVVVDVSSFFVFPRIMNGLWAYKNYVFFWKTHACAIRVFDFYASANRLFSTVQPAIANNRHSKCYLFWWELDGDEITRCICSANQYRTTKQTNLTCFCTHLYEYIILKDKWSNTRKQYVCY